ncbi:MAG: lysine exporter LysO family protein [Clostridiales bacterium]|nr:lysine exporter LysO family protein [Clostridiales bacterium]
MTLSILISIIVGIICGMTLLPQSIAPHMDMFTTIALNILILFVGIDIGMNKHIFKDVKKHGLLLIIIPFSIVIGSIIGGLVTSIIIDYDTNISLAISAGFGWYSLSGILLTKLDSAEIGAIAFLTNVFREVFAVLTIPFIARYLNKYTTIAPAGATSMDTMLPIVSRYTNPEIVVISFFNGVVLSSLVPILVPFFYSLK